MQKLLCRFVQLPLSNREKEWLNKVYNCVEMELCGMYVYSLRTIQSSNSKLATHTYLGLPYFQATINLSLRHVSKAMGMANNSASTVSTLIL